MALALTVDVGWPWWAITAIACGAVTASVAALVLFRDRAVRSVAGLLAAEGVVIAVLAPLVMPNMHSGKSSMAVQESAVSAHSSDRVIHVIEHAPPPDMQMSGNLQTFANPVFDARNAKKIGRDQGMCAHIVVAKAWECVWTTFLPGGQITAEGPESDTGITFSFAITGGTGKYENARGWLEEKAHNKAGTQFDEFFHVSG